MGRRVRHSDAQRNLKDERAKAGEVPIAGWLLVLNGPQMGEDYRVREGKNLIGSRPECEIAIDDPYVSARHATLTLKRTGPREGLFRIVDLDSENGTFHNDNQEPLSMEELVDNDVVSFGKTRCKFKCVG